jgi:UDP-N-acetylmuramoyl-tripeptide--D-alanyl-D-alanine ligase
MEAVLELLRDFDTPGRRIMVCGDMKEFGYEAAPQHHRLGSQAVTLGGVDLLLACGQYARYVVGGARAAGMPRMRSIAVRTVEETLPYLGQAILPGDVVLVTGARSLELQRVVEALHRYPLRRGA